MNGAHLHLMVNHLPIFATAFGLVFLLLGLWRPALAVVRRAGLLFLVVGGLGAGAAYLTGEPAEEVVEDLPGVTNERIHEHEEAAEFALIVCGAAGLVALALLWRRRGREIDNASTMIAAGATVLAFAVLARAAWLGGEVRHTELRPGFTAAEEGGGGPAADRD